MLHPLIKVTQGETIQGKGMVATGLIRAGEVISRLEPGQPTIPIAEILTWSQAEQDALMHYAYQCSATHVVNEQGEEKYMNHSCEANTWWADDDTLVASRDIQPGEEVTYDYATTDVSIPYSMPCGCGAATCRGTITHLDYLDPAWQARYSGHLPAHTQALIDTA